MAQASRPSPEFKRKALGVVFTCGRDSELMAPFEELFRACWPAAEIVWAVDSSDPVAPPGGRTVACAWQSAHRTRAVLDAMADAAARTAAEWVFKLDVDTAHLSADWLHLARPDSVLVGLQSGRGLFGMLGMAFAIRRETLAEIHAGTDCAALGNEADGIHRAVRKRHLNEVWLWPHRPRTGGLFCSMSDPAHAPEYRRRFSLVHCGVGDKSKAAGLLRALH